MISFSIPYSTQFNVFASSEIFSSIEKSSLGISYDELKKLSLLSVSVECDLDFNCLSFSSNLTAALKKHFLGFNPKAILINSVNSSANIVVVKISNFSDLAEGL